MLVSAISLVVLGGIVLAFVAFRSPEQPLSVASETKDGVLKIDTDGDGMPDTVISSGEAEDQPATGANNSGQGSQGSQAGSGGSSGGSSSGGSGGGNTNSGECPAYPSFPDENCTGPSGNLTLYTGSHEFRTNGQVIENVEIHTDGIYLPASNVTFRNVKIVYTGPMDGTFAIINNNNNSGNVFEDCIIDGQGKVARAITGSGVTVRNCEIMGVGNAIETDTPMVVEENYIHDIRTADGTDWHADGLQTPSGADNVTVRHNTIILTGSETGAINIMGTVSNPAENVLIEHNLFAGGGYTIYAGPGVNYRVINNHMSTQIYPKVGFYNIWYWDPSEDGDVTRSGNVIHETGAAANDNL